MKLIVFVEDSYGVEFHRVVLDKLYRAGLLHGGRRPEVRHLPAKKCNPAVFRKMLGAVFREVRSGGAWRILVIDSEGRPPREAVESDILRHVRRHRERFRVIAVVPRHEAWLCRGLGGDRGGCRSRPEGFLSRYAGRPYDRKTKHLLAELARGMDVCRLIGEEDFVEYLAGLCWLLGDRGAFCKELAGHGRIGRRVC
ncbi:hypothetical protein [Pyrodictium abyssi]|uniref:DUF4276 family protein n=1 Tax=Pyrodictium abyssi TaxID=54256 RepID=A0ABM8ITU4_9CREN|nr:hypothetical protein PABY_05450 [Pyrodictium abyssi]